MKYYLVYRQYSEKEKKKHPEQYVFYGWSDSKEMIKAFKSQRNPDKYLIQKQDMDEIAEGFRIDELPEDTEIDYVKLRSVSTGEIVRFITTRNELKNIEKWIQRLFIDKARLVDRDKGKTRLLELYMNLSEWYKGALEYIGFNPPELDALFDSVMYRETWGTDTEIEHRIDEAYDGYTDWPQEEQIRDLSIPGLCNFIEIHNKIIYSLESFVKAAKDDL